MDGKQLKICSSKTYLIQSIHIKVGSNIDLFPFYLLSSWPKIYINGHAGRT